MNPVYIRGLGHASAAGTDLGAACESVFAGRLSYRSETLPPALDAAVPYAAIDFDPPAEPGREAWRIRAHALLERVCGEAVASAGLAPAELADGVLLVGTSSATIGLGEERYPGTRELNLDHVAGDIRRQLDWRGPDFTVSTACTSSLNAVLSAAELIRAGAAGHALVVGFDLYNRTALAGFGGLGLLSPGTCRPFDRDRDGLVLGEAVSAVVLSAEPGRQPAARLLGGAHRVDADSMTGVAEDGSSVAETLIGALADAGLTPADVDLIKAQAAGSPPNDAAEARGIRRVFEAPPAVLSLKPYLGHCLGASGAAELSLLLGCHARGRWPATPGFREPDADGGLTPLTEPTAARAARMLCTVFGFGGSLTSLVVETEAPG